MLNLNDKVSFRKASAIFFTTSQKAESQVTLVNIEMHIKNILTAEV